MKVTALTVRPYSLPFRAPIRTAAGVFPVRRGVLVEVRDERGMRGIGDAAPWPGFGDGRDAIAALGDLAAAWSVGAPGGLGATGIAGALESPGDVARAVVALGLPPEAACALEQALLDLLTRGRGVPLHRALGPSAERSVAVHSLVADAEDAVVAVAAGFTALKVKIAGDLAPADARVAAIRAAVGPSVRLRLDANGGWTREEAVEAARRLARHAPEWIEQPTRDLAGLAAVRATGVAVAADESLGSAADLEAVIAAGAADVAVIKPMFAGGLLAARQLALRAVEAGLRAVVTCSLESAVGRWGALHLAATLPGGEAHGLLAPLARDLAPCATLDGGRLLVPTAPIELRGSEAPC